MNKKKVRRLNVALYLVALIGVALFIVAIVWLLGTVHSKSNAVPGSIYFAITAAFPLMMVAGISFGLMETTPHKGIVADLEDKTLTTRRQADGYHEVTVTYSAFVTTDYRKGWITNIDEEKFRTLHIGETASF